jgi:polysaccharide deacetylase family protein (PEP-CTERM system associated)
MDPARTITVTLDLEDHRLGTDATRRYKNNSARILEFLDARQIRATVFIVGDLIEQCRDLIRAASDAGHELALHSTTHTALTREHATTLAPQLIAARDSLQNMTGKAVLGFRAPVFSLTPATVWITDLLAECGFRYSSSVLPAAHPLYGYTGAPRETFRWPSGLVEFPVPIGRVGPASLPFLGGIYLRYLPLQVIRALSKRLANGTVRWTYLHPYDIDADEAYYRFPGTSAPMSVLLWRRRRHTLKRLDALLGGDGHVAGTPLAEQFATLEENALPQFEPTLAGR